ncbi:hypothetical protein Tco_0923173 [Tanacetum coccineum]|uniref:Uncharacterized protein n=1 Tax=Tanacetum coccineum TaxID=301880 RepID=A0ABQ5D7E1_9ASTR
MTLYGTKTEAMQLTTKRKVAVLDAEAEVAFLADVECTCDDNPMQQQLSMANLNHPSSSTLATKDSQDDPTEASPDPDPSAIPTLCAYMINTFIRELTT